MMKKKTVHHAADVPHWFSTRPAKRHTEKQFLLISAGWVAVFVGIVVTQAYMSFGDWQYMTLGLAVSLPFIVVPLLFPAPSERNTPILDRYFVKANVWIGIFGFVGNYFWTHYFYQVLGASYTFPVTIQLNNVPVFLYLITHAYFSSYYTVSNLILRRFWHSCPTQPAVRFILSAVFIFTMSVVTAFMETYTISEVPYYSHTNKFMMYTVGSVFYAIYFCVSFPMFYRVDEQGGDKWDIWRAAIDALGAAMLVFILLDFWRLFLPAIAPTSSNWKGIPYY